MLEIDTDSTVPTGFVLHLPGECHLMYQISSVVADIILYMLANQHGKNWRIPSLTRKGI